MLKKKNDTTQIIFLKAIQTVDDEPAQTSLFVRQDYFQDIVFHPQLSDESKVICEGSGKKKHEFRYSLRIRGYEIESEHSQGTSFCYNLTAKYEPH